MEYFVTITITLNERYSLDLCIGSTFYFLKIKLKLKLRIIFFFSYMIIIVIQIFTNDRKFHFDPCFFLLFFPTNFYTRLRNEWVSFFFLFPRFSINSRKVLLKYSARNSSEEGGEEVRNFFFFREMGMSLEKVESSDRGIFVKFARSFGTVKRKFHPDQSLVSEYSELYSELDRDDASISESKR